MQRGALAYQSWQVIHTRHSCWTPLHCQDCPGILGLTLPLELTSGLQSIMLTSDMPWCTWTIQIPDTPLPTWQAWEAKTFTIAPTPTTAFTPYLSDHLNLHSFFEPEMQNILLPSPICTPPRALKIHYCSVFILFQNIGIKKKKLILPWWLNSTRKSKTHKVIIFLKNSTSDMLKICF